MPYNGIISKVVKTLPNGLDKKIYEYQCKLHESLSKACMWMKSFINMTRKVIETKLSNFGMRF